MSDQLRHRIVDGRTRESTDSSNCASRDEPRTPTVERDEAGAAVSRKQQHALSKWLTEADRTRDELVYQLDAHVGDTLRDFVYNIIFDAETKRGGGAHNADLARLRGLDASKKQRAPAAKRETEETNTNDESNTSAKTTQRPDGVARLYEKQFEMRSSVLTEMLRISHIRTVAHMFTAALIIFTLNALLHDLVEQRSLNAILHLDLFTAQFERFNHAIVLWLQMLAATILCVYPSFHFWHTQRASYWRSGPSALAAFDYAFAAAYAAYMAVFFVLSLNRLLELALPPASVLIVVIEQVRLMMKTHAFVRECSRRCLADFENVTLAQSISDMQKQRTRAETDADADDADADGVRGYSPHFSQFLYFLFAPTLVYRDSYPRTRTVRWRVVVNYVMQFCGCVIFQHFLLARFCAPTFQRFGLEAIETKQLLVWIFSSMIPGSLFLLLGFYLLLHIWMNMFAEMLRFGDRLFYSDWWNSHTFARYYRTWNIVVHDWLYSYIYRDAYLLLGAKRKVSRTAAMAVVFLISAIVHEYIVAIVMGFFYPVLFFSFMGAGFGFIFLTDKGSSPWWNIFMWFCLFTGTGVILCLLTIEWYARLNCQPIAGNPTLDFFIPRSWSCVPVKSV